ncbi:MAG: hypothetical protein ACD_30C00040G0031 [uncultured bacterium]|uniref:Uncharacterized protein n=4 Tax=Candidatus Daviesiibacteriota TaxID=1752718 RepID=A0A0G0F9I2_9BACT|nr:MAG: hypothetical protein ACD_30C00040G0031 [uncultured bacterium]KKQ10165.1 MAG: hypothetical protein US19_C0008G0008 [Candidatus Daviesbacteria bacterium GW2011_GWB1_36_5]OGE17157.1 MAG: hypothetical protein A2858_00435 [Candidatus Daviesbacteria bacterium RIFCSPHIGHO2_01_FULL_36_37]OGE35938.1 MAG: hypothetical protein A3E66_01430 [Candidatus Daviesbacteria bacterium RIFCSPHIGHO2_12_FULL_37_16]
MQSWSQKGYISVFVIIFLLVLSFALYPLKYPKSEPVSTSNCPIIGIAPSYNPPFITQFPENRGNRQVMVDYILVRENVILGGRELILNAPQGEHASEWPNHLTEPITKPDGTTKLYRPMLADDWGELGAKDEFQAVGYNNFDQDGTKGGGNRIYNFNKEGYVYAMHLTDTGTPITVDLDPTGPGGEPPFAQIVDLYQMKSIYDDPSRAYDDDGKIFVCPKNSRFLSKDLTYAGSSNDQDISIPTQASSSGQQLQLQWFKFNFSSNSLLDVTCKPAIYLYPKEKSLVNVKVNTKGLLSYVDPPYDQKFGWNITAYPDGTITTLNSELLTQSYPYLYYESKIPDQLIKKPDTGWVVEKTKLISLLNENLPKLGLNSTQTKDFIEYWEKALPDSPYYFVGIIDQENIDNVEPLEITPKPDYINRVRVYFETLDQPKKVQAPVLTNNYQLTTNNFSVVEWGGMVKRDKNHPFICSE